MLHVLAHAARYLFVLDFGNHEASSVVGDGKRNSWNGWEEIMIVFYCYCCYDYYYYYYSCCCYYCCYYDYYNCLLLLLLQ